MASTGTTTGSSEGEGWVAKREMEIKFIGHASEGEDDEVNRWLREVELTEVAKEDALWYGCQNGHKGVVRALVGSGVNVNSKEGDALLQASQRGYWGIVDVLIENGADVEAALLKWWGQGWWLMGKERDKVQKKLAEKYLAHLGLGKSEKE